MSDNPDISADLTTLFRDKMRVRGRTLQKVVSRAGRRLPRRQREAAARLVEAEGLGQNPRLRLMLDEEALQADRDSVADFLSGIDPADERRGWYLGILASLAVNLLSLFILLVAVLIWRGFL